MTVTRRLWSQLTRHTRRALAVPALALASATLVLPQPAQALTVMLNFTGSSTTDMWGVTTVSESFASWGFGMSINQLRNATLAAVIDDFHGFPSLGGDANSPLPVGKQLNIDFEISFGLTAPTSGDSDYYFVNIGDASPNQGFLGQACYGCVRGNGSPAAVGSQVGSVLTDTIAGLLPLADNDTERLNLLVGTLTHEIGHTLLLDHPSGPQTNPGESIYSVMSTGAFPTSMPNNQRILDRDFSYAEFQTLIRTVGLRDIPTHQVPEPASWLLVAAAAALASRRRSTTRLH
ncbi:PEP-CTERM sorting domain-containing protein [Inhella proteolytica]|uniref:PEP-CTERM sorting domain-containing protein n=1 Tax=Inhella proteolytica TaxID=2795029 RepID=A0A931ND33_9BURK|nr:PEP-CTERM sorting domain-containing protein [Inhella proteolytica]MBH9576242.1 PEP-CTERM sorting domain-containing protein [Inhella proteolytica]